MSAVTFDVRYSIDNVDNGQTQIASVPISIIEQCYLVLKELYPYFETPFRVSKRRITQINFSFVGKLERGISSINIRCNITYEVTEQSGTIYTNVSSCIHCCILGGEGDAHTIMLDNIRSIFK